MDYVILNEADGERRLAVKVFRDGRARFMVTENGHVHYFENFYVDRNVANLVVVELGRIWSDLEEDGVADVIVGIGAGRDEPTFKTIHPDDASAIIAVLRGFVWGNNDTFVDMKIERPPLVVDALGKSDDLDFTQPLAI